MALCQQRFGRSATDPLAGDRFPDDELASLLPSAATVGSWLFPDFGSTQGAIPKGGGRGDDPNHPVGRATIAIIEALPDFQRLEVAPEELMGLLVARYGPDSPPEPEPFLPAGFAEGRPNAHLRLASGMVIVDERGRIQDMRGLIREESSPQTANSRLDQGARLSDVIDLTWTEPRPLELRDVEQHLLQLAGEVVAGSAVRFSAYEAPCYRAALRVHLGDCANPVGIGGVLQASPKYVEGISAVRVRCYLEVWASVLSSTPVEFRSIPSFSPDSLQGP